MNSLLCDINHFFFSKIKTKQNKQTNRAGHNFFSILDNVFNDGIWCRLQKNFTWALAVLVLIRGGEW